MMTEDAREIVEELVRLLGLSPYPQMPNAAGDRAKAIERARAFLRGTS